MAERYPDRSKQPTKNGFFCPVCMGKAKNPKILPCGHSFCCKCLVDWTEGKVKESAFPCPFCKKSTALPNEGINGFITPFFHIVDPNKETSNGDVPWSLSGEENSENLVDNSDQPPQPSNVCSKHAGELMQWFCGQCNAALCEICKADAHANHTPCVSLITKIQAIQRDILGEKYQGLLVKAEKMSTTLDQQNKSYHKQESKVIEEVLNRAEIAKHAVDSYSTHIINSIQKSENHRINEQKDADSKALNENFIELTQKMNAGKEIEFTAENQSECIEMENSIDRAALELRGTINKVPYVVPYITIGKQNQIVEADMQHLIGKIMRGYYDHPEQDGAQHKYAPPKKPGQMYYLVPAKHCPMHGQTDTNITVKALYQYKGEEGELSFEKGALITNVKKYPDGMWRGNIGDQRGYFPATFVEEQEKEDEENAGNENED